MRVDEVAAWMLSNRVQLNSSKMEVLWCATSRRQHQIPQTPMCARTSSSQQPQYSIWESTSTLMPRLQDSIYSCFSVLRQIRSIRQSVTDMFSCRCVIIALVLSNLVYGNATLAGLPDCSLKRLQSVMNAAARQESTIPSLRCCVTYTGCE